jgi:pimeloyl-ACP methyl ester carboxylesterase
VSVVIPARTFFLIGVRGTQFAYDWLINLNIAKAKGASGEYFHIGFLREADKLALELRTRLLDRYANRIASRDCAVYLAGHSLGGAIAAILSQMQLAVPINACYMFGAPRISNSKKMTGLYQPFAMRRALDVVPHCPPSAFGYIDFLNQKAPNGDPCTLTGGIELYFFASCFSGSQ